MSNGRCVVRVLREYKFIDFHGEGRSVSFRHIVKSKSLSDPVCKLDSDINFFMIRSVEGLKNIFFNSNGYTFHVHIDEIKIADLAIGIKRESDCLFFPVPRGVAKHRLLHSIEACFVSPVSRSGVVIFGCSVDFV